MKRLRCLLLPILCGLVAVGFVAEEARPDVPVVRLCWPADLPVYDHVVIVIEENKDYSQIFESPSAPFINQLRAKGANFTRMFGEEHNSQGNYFWLFSGDNQGVGFRDGVPDVKVRDTLNLGTSLLQKQRSFKGYSEDLPAIGSKVLYWPDDEKRGDRLYARKHVPWISFDNVPNKGTADTSCNLQFKDFPTDFNKLPTVAIVVPNLKNDMHDTDRSIKDPDEALRQCVCRGDTWLRDNLGSYAEWAVTNKSLLIITFDECDDQSSITGLTDPGLPDTPANKDRRNQIFTCFFGAHIKPGDYATEKGITHVNILRTLEAMYGLPKAGCQQANALKAGIGDDYLITDCFERIRATGASRGK